MLDYTDYRNFEAVIDNARTACFNRGQRVEDHFVEITEMIGDVPHLRAEIGDPPSSGVFV